MSPKDLVSAGGVSAQQLAEIEARLKALCPGQANLEFILNAPGAK